LVLVAWFVVVIVGIYVRVHWNLLSWRYHRHVTVTVIISLFIVCIGVVLMIYEVWRFIVIL